MKFQTISVRLLITMIQYLTKEQLEKLEEELKYLKKDGRIKVAKQLKQAIEYGDLSENAAYSVAKEAQADLERKIMEMEILSRNAIIIEKKNEGIVQIGSTIKLKNRNKNIQYTIVGSREADPGNNLISNESPLGTTLLGKKIGDIVKTSTPNGIIQYKIIGIE